MPRLTSFILGVGITIFIIGSMLFVSWVLNLGFDNFTFARLVDGTYYFLTCGRFEAYGLQEAFVSPPCWFMEPQQSSVLHWIVLAVWLAGLGLIIYALVNRQRMKVPQL